MTINSYIKLNGTNFSETWFRVLSRGYKHISEKITRPTMTVTGKMDVQSAPVANRFQYTLKVYETDPDGGSYGTLSDLEAFFDEDVPPDSILTLTEPNDANSHSVVMSGRFEPKNQSPKISGVNAVFWVDVEFIEV